jgi:proteasome lid subunit RPN8/RPN11
MFVELHDPTRRELCRLCETAYPFEACGAVLGLGGGETHPWHVTRVVSGPNEHGDDRRSRYLIAPEFLLAIEQQCRCTDEQVLGYFHSHPDCPASPSDQDLALAWPGCLYVICSVMDARAVDIRAFAKIEQTGPLLCLPITEEPRESGQHLASLVRPNQPVLELSTCLSRS